MIDENGIVKSGITDNMILFAGWENSTEVINYIEEETGPTAGNEYLIVKNVNGVDRALKYIPNSLDYVNEVDVQDNQINSLDDTACIWKCDNKGNGSNSALILFNDTTSFNINSNKNLLQDARYFKQNITTSKKMIYADAITSTSLTMFSLEESTQEFNSSLENKLMSENISEEQEIQGEVIEPEESTDIKQEENDLPADNQLQDDQSVMPKSEETILSQVSKDVLPKEPESNNALIKDDESESGTQKEGDIQEDHEEN